jgi:hypothetical protein
MTISKYIWEYGDELKKIFPESAFDAVYDVFAKHSGGVDTVDEAALQLILNCYPNASDEMKKLLCNFIAYQTR